MHVVHDTLAALEIGGCSLCCLNSLCQAESSVKGEVLLCKEFTLNCLMFQPTNKANLKHLVESSAEVAVF